MRPRANLHGRRGSGAGRLLGVGILSFASPPASAITLPTESGDSIVIDLGGAWPKLSGSDFRLVGDLTLGYLSESWGVTGSGSIAAYDFTGETLLSDSTKIAGSLDGYYLTGAPTSVFRFEARFSGSSALYDSTRIPIGAGMPQAFFVDETSIMTRGSLLVGGRLRLQDILAVAVLVGGGVQVELYDTVKIDPTDPTVIDEREEVNVRLEARMTARWRTVPTVVSLRVASDLSRFSITREDFVVSAQGMATTSAALSTQLESHTRLFVEVDYLNFFGITPAIYGGFDLVDLSSPAGSVTSVVPLIGLDVVFSS